MNEPKLYPDIRQRKWMNRCYRAALLGVMIWLFAFLGFRIQNETYRMGYVVFILAPVVYLIAPLELLLCLITLQSWNRWSDHRKRLITLFCSFGILAFLVVQIALSN